MEFPTTFATIGVTMSYLARTSTRTRSPALPMSPLQPDSATHSSAASCPKMSTAKPGEALSAGSSASTWPRMLPLGPQVAFVGVHLGEGCALAGGVLQADVHAIGTPEIEDAHHEQHHDRRDQCQLHDGGSSVVPGRAQSSHALASSARRARHLSADPAVPACSATAARTSRADRRPGRRLVQWPAVAEPTALPPTGPGAPTPPIAIAGGAAAARPHLGGMVPVPDPVIDRLRRTGAGVSTDAAVRAEASRDWWPGAMIWATEGEVPGLAGVVVSPTSADQVAAVLRLCNAARSRSPPPAGVPGCAGRPCPSSAASSSTPLGSPASSPSTRSRWSSTWPPAPSATTSRPSLRARGLTVGHWPQSVALSTVGGWVACRGAGQLSNRYGKIEDMVVGLDVVLADGTAITTGGGPRSAVGPDLTQLFVGSEGTLGVITGVRLRLHPAPQVQREAAYAFDSFSAANDACRRIVQRGLPPAVLRVYDATEADRSYQTGDAPCCS